MGTRIKAERSGLMARCVCVVTMMMCCFAANAAGTSERLHTLYIARTHTSSYSHRTDTLTEAQRDSIAEAALANAKEKKERAEVVIDNVTNFDGANDGVKTRKQKEAEAKAAREQQKQREADRRARLKAERDSIDNAIRERHKAEKEAEKERMIREKAADRALRDSANAAADSIKREKKEAERREKARVDSIAKQKRDSWKNLTKAEKDELRRKHDAKKQLYDEGRKKAAKLDSVGDHLTKYLRDSLYHEAWRVEMSKSKLRKWTKYFTRIYGENKNTVMRQIRDSIDTVRHDRKAAMYSGVEMDEKTKRVYGKLLLTELFNRKNEEQNKSMIRALDTYTALYDQIKIANQRATYLDSLALEKNRKPGLSVYSMLQKRSKEREKRIWREVDHYMRSHELAPYDPADGTFGTVVDVGNMFTNDSNYNVFRDQMRVPLWKRFSLRTNTIGWLLGVPNLGVEFDLSGDPASQYSVLVTGYLKPNTLKGNTVKSRFDYSVWSLNIEGRKYWRTGGKQTVQHMLEWDINDYTLDTTRPDTLPSQEREKIYGFYYLVNDTAQNSEYKSPLVQLFKGTAPLNPYSDGDTSVVIRTANFAKRLWQPFRYNVLSGRYNHKPSMKRLYYLGGMVGYERYRYVFNSAGQQGKRAYICATGGVVFENLASFNNGSAIDVEFGAAVGLQGTTYFNFDYNKEFACYEYRNHHQRKITPWPTIHDLHVSLIYSFRPFSKRAHNLFLTEEFRKKMDEVRYHNVAAADKVIDHYTKRAHLKRRNRFDNEVEKKEYGKRKDDRKKKKEEKAQLKAEIEQYGMPKAEYDRRWAEEHPEEAKQQAAEKAKEAPEARQYKQPKVGRHVVFDPNDL